MAREGEAWRPARRAASGRGFVGPEGSGLCPGGGGFYTYYLHQPVLPVFERKFGVSPAMASRSVLALIIGVTLAHMPFGLLTATTCGL